MRQPQFTETNKLIAFALNLIDTISGMIIHETVPSPIAYPIINVITEIKNTTNYILLLMNQN